MQNRESFASFEASKDWEKKTNNIGRRRSMHKVLELIAAGAILKMGKTFRERSRQREPVIYLPKNAEEVAKFLSIKANIPTNIILTEMQKLKQSGEVEFMYDNKTYVLKVAKISGGRIKGATLNVKTRRVV